MPDKAISTGKRDIKRPFPFWVRHFFDCKEQALTDAGDDLTPRGTAVTEVIDRAGQAKARERAQAYVGGNPLGFLIPYSHTFAEGSQYYFTNWLTWPSGGKPTGLDPDGPGWVMPGSRDAMLLVAGRAILDPPTDPDYGGFLAFYLGDKGTGQLKVQPYYAVWIDESAHASNIRQRIATPWQSAYRARVHGDFYIFAAVKRGTTLEHYANGVLTGSVDLAAHYGGELVAGFSNWQPVDDMRTGHAAYGDIATCTAGLISGGACETLGEEVPGLFSAHAPNTGASGELAQDVAGLVVGVFDNGAPPASVLAAGMADMLTPWAAGSKGFPAAWYRYR